MSNIVTVEVKAEWQKVQHDTFTCRKCKHLFLGGECWQLVVSTPKIENTTCTVSNVILCSACYNILHDHV